MIRKSLVIAATALTTIGATLPTSAGPLALQRGFDLCSSEIRAQHEGVALDRSYLLQRHDVQNTYFINSTAWEDGARVQHKSACATRKNGRRLLALETTYGRWRQAGGVVGIEVASQ